MRYLIAVVAALAFAGPAVAAELSTTNDKDHQYGWVIGQGSPQTTGAEGGVAGAVGGDAGASGATGGTGTGGGATGGTGTK